VEEEEVMVEVTEVSMMKATEEDGVASEEEEVEEEVEDEDVVEVAVWGLNAVITVDRVAISPGIVPITIMSN